MDKRIVRDGQRFQRPDSRPIFRSRKKVLTIALGLFWVLLIAQLVGGRQGLLRLARVNNKIEHRIAALSSKEVRVEAMEEKIEALRNDPIAQEEVARTELGQATPGAIVFRFEDGEE
ncbi:MAG: hypothetical protein CME06_16295 [Gemmatimonadetes bacterium]|nr:hypothetical protein [Gemmatimonadota bacterium]